MNGEDTTFTVPDIPARRIERSPAMKVPCMECGKPINPTYLREHFRKQHPDVTPPPPRKRGRKKQQNGGSLPGRDVVMTVLEVVFPDGIPVRHFDAVLRWMDQTVAFMKVVQK